MLEIMLPAFAASVILVGIHAYLGIHILARGVIFVDLALAQIAALGAITGVLLGFELHTTGSYLASLLATFIGAAVFSLTRGKKTSGAMQEATIGIVYVVSAALSVMVLDHLPSEAEHLKGMLVGNILFTTWPQVLKTTALYLAVGLAHYLCREKFVAISFKPEEAAKSGMRVRFWDFLFYALFGFVVTSSVELAGVLLVFTFLIIPTVSALQFAQSLSGRLFLSWGMGVATSFAGILMSAKYDLPTGPAMVCAFGILALGSFIARSYLHRTRQSRSMS
ncbi:MAG: ABC transporter [Elusimicrobia bacterium RIFOXYA12_FULL_51_18]|nr:MAG: ABC transporter [Elusimicrobia bacterium RIFOXYA12_FULL_51_18]OGS30104.1 MAG: ABC transporter [Elusimicrobia bacterium RIFOXYA2_FULL_53_38]